MTTAGDEAEVAGRCVLRNRIAKDFKPDPVNTR